MSPASPITETMTVDLAGLPVGAGHPCVVIAEAGLNHNGDLKLALRLIEAAAASGCPIVKFQKRDVANLAVGPLLDAADTRFPSFGATYRQLREHLEFGWDEYRQLKQASEARGLRFMVTPFDLASLEFLERLGVPAYKIASHSVTNLPLLEGVARLGKTVILSTGMCAWDELDEAVAVFKRCGTPLVLLHCVSAYPTPPEEANLRLIPALGRRYGVPVGYSGHEIGHDLTLAAVAMGAAVVERHITLDRNLEGLDHKLSVPPEELTAMVQAIRQIEQGLGDGEKRVTEREWVTRRKYHVSIVSRRAIAPGETLTEQVVTFKNPGTGLPPRRLAEVVGRRAKAEIPADTLISLEMLE